MKASYLERCGVPPRAAPLVSRVFNHGSEGAGTVHRALCTVHEERRGGGGESDTVFPRQRRGGGPSDIVLSR